MPDLLINNSLFFKQFSNITQDSRLRGNNGISCFQAAYSAFKSSNSACKITP